MQAIFIVVVVLPHFCYIIITWLLFFSFVNVRYICYMTHFSPNISALNALYCIFAAVCVNNSSYLAFHQRNVDSLSQATERTALKHSTCLYFIKYYLIYTLRTSGKFCDLLLFVLHVVIRQHSVLIIMQ